MYVRIVSINAAENMERIYNLTRPSLLDGLAYSATMLKDYGNVVSSPYPPQYLIGTFLSNIILNQKIQDFMKKHYRDDPETIGDKFSAIISFFNFDSPYLRNIRYPVLGEQEVFIF